MKKRVTQEEKELYVQELRQRIKEFGYWSNEVFTFNNLGQKLYGYTLWEKLHNEAKLN